MLMEAKDVGWKLALPSLSGSRMYMLSTSSGHSSSQTASGVGGYSALVAWEQFSGELVTLSSTFLDTEAYLPYTASSKSLSVSRAPLSSCCPTGQLCYSLLHIAGTVMGNAPVSIASCGLPASGRQTVSGSGML